MMDFNNNGLIRSLKQGIQMFIDSNPLDTLAIKDWESRLDYLYRIYVLMSDCNPLESNILDDLEYKYGVRSLLFQSYEYIGKNLNHLYACLSLLFESAGAVRKNTLGHDVLTREGSVIVDVEGMLTCLTHGSVDIAVWDSYDQVLYIMDLKSGLASMSSTVVENSRQKMLSKNKFVFSKIIPIVVPHIVTKFSNVKYSPKVVNANPDVPIDLTLSDKLCKLIIPSTNEDRLSLENLLNSIIKEPIEEYLATYFTNIIELPTIDISDNYEYLRSTYFDLPNLDYSDLTKLQEILGSLLKYLKKYNRFSKIIKLFELPLFRVPAEQKTTGFDPLFPVHKHDKLPNSQLIKPSLLIFSFNKFLRQLAKPDGIVACKCVFDSTKKDNIMFSPIDYKSIEQDFKHPQSSMKSGCIAVFRAKYDRKSMKKSLLDSGRMTRSDWADIGLELVNGNLIQIAWPKYRKKYGLGFNITKRLSSVHDMCVKKGLPVLYFKNVASILWGTQAFDYKYSNINITDKKRLEELFSRRRESNRFHNLDGKEISAVNVKKIPLKSCSIMGAYSSFKECVQTPLSTKSYYSSGIVNRVAEINKSSVLNNVSAAAISSFLHTLSNHFSVGSLESMYSEGTLISSALRVTGMGSNDYFLSSDNRTNMVSLIMLNANLEKFKSCFVKTIYLTKNDTLTNDFIESHKGNFTTYAVHKIPAESELRVIELPFRSRDRNKLEYSLKGTHSIVSSLSSIYEHNIHKFEGKSTQYITEYMAPIYRDFIEFSMINNQNFSLVSGQIRYLWISAMSESSDFSGIYMKMEGARLSNVRCLEYVTKCLIQPTIMCLVKHSVKSIQKKRTLHELEFYDDNEILKFNFPDYPLLVSDVELSIDLFTMSSRFNKFKSESNGYLAMDYNTIIEQDDKYREQLKEPKSLIGLSKSDIDKILSFDSVTDLYTYLADNREAVKNDLISRLKSLLEDNLGTFRDTRFDIVKSPQFSCNIFYQLLAFLRKSRSHRVPRIEEFNSKNMMEFFTARGSVEHSKDPKFGIKAIRKFNATMEFISSYSRGKEDVSSSIMCSSEINNNPYKEINKLLAVEHICKTKSMQVSINRIFDKDQNGNNREITAMNSPAFIMTNVAEEMFSTVSKRMRVDMITTKNKTLELYDYFKTIVLTELQDIFYLNIDRSKWATNTCQASLNLLQGIFSPDLNTYKIMHVLYRMQVNKRVLIPNQLLNEILSNTTREEWYSPDMKELSVELFPSGVSAKDDFIRHIKHRCSFGSSKLKPYAIIAGGFPQGTQGITSSIFASCLADLENEILTKSLLKCGVTAQIDTKVTSDDMVSRFVLTYQEYQKRFAGSKMLAAVSALQSLSNQVLNIYKSNCSRIIGEMNSTFMYKGSLISPMLKFMFSLVDTGSLKSYESDMVGASLSGTSILSFGGSLFLSDMLSVINVKLVMDQYNMWPSIGHNLLMKQTNSPFEGIGLPLELGGIPNINTACSILSPMYPATSTWEGIFKESTNVSPLLLSKYYAESLFESVESADPELRKWSERQDSVPINFLMCSSPGGIRSLIRPNAGVVKAMIRANPKNLTIDMIPKLASSPFDIQSVIATAITRLKTVPIESDLRYSFFIRHSELNCNPKRPIFSVSSNHPIYNTVNGICRVSTKYFSRIDFVEMVKSITSKDEIINLSENLIKRKINTILDTDEIVNEIHNDIISTHELSYLTENMKFNIADTSEKKMGPSRLRVNRGININSIKLELYTQLIGSSNISHFENHAPDRFVPSKIDMSSDSIIIAVSTVENISNSLSKILGKERFIFNTVESVRSNSQQAIFSIINKNSLRGFKVKTSNRCKINVDSNIGRVVTGSKSFNSLNRSSKLVSHSFANAHLINTPHSLEKLGKLNIYSDTIEFNPFSNFSNIQDISTPFEPTISIGRNSADTVMSIPQFISRYTISIDSYIIIKNRMTPNRYIGIPLESYKSVDPINYTFSSRHIKPDKHVIVRVRSEPLFKYIHMFYVSEIFNIVNNSNSIEMCPNLTNILTGEEIPMKPASRTHFIGEKSKDIYLIIPTFVNEKKHAYQYGNGLFLIYFFPLFSGINIHQLKTRGNNIKCLLPVCELPHDKLSEDIIGNIVCRNIPYYSEELNHFQIVAHTHSIMSDNSTDHTITNNLISDVQKSIIMSKSISNLTNKLLLSSIFYIDKIGMVSYHGFHDSMDATSVTTSNDVQQIIESSHVDGLRIINIYNPYFKNTMTDRKLILAICVIFCFHNYRFNNPTNIEQLNSMEDTFSGFLEPTIEGSDNESLDEPDNLDEYITNIVSSNNTNLQDSDIDMADLNNINSLYSDLMEAEESGRMSNIGLESEDTY